jgi:hypothetical protein
MRRKRLQVPLLALAAALFSLLTLVPTPSDTASPEPHQLLPQLDESLLRQDFASWMAGRLPARSPGARPVVSAADLAAALGQLPSPKLAAFQNSEVAARRQVLQRLPYGMVLGEVCDRNHVDSLLVAAVVEAESQFVANAVSPEGAVGLMQLLPSTGRDYGVKDLFDPVANLDAGSRYLGGLLVRFGGDRELAIAAYNAGPEVVSRYHRRVPPFRETRDFVRKVLSSYQTHHDRVAALAGDAAPGRDAERLAYASGRIGRGLDAYRRAPSTHRLTRGLTPARGEQRDILAAFGR